MHSLSSIRILVEEHDSLKIDHFSVPVNIGSNADRGLLNHVLYLEISHDDSLQPKIQSKITQKVVLRIPKLFAIKVILSTVKINIIHIEFAF